MWLRDPEERSDLSSHGGTQKGKDATTACSLFAEILKPNDMEGVLKVLSPLKDPWDALETVILFTVFQHMDVEGTQSSHGRHFHRATNPC